MATTETIVNGTGSNRFLNFSFAYLKTEDVKVELQKFKVSTSKVDATQSTAPPFTINLNQPTQVELTAVTASDYQNADGSLKQYFGDGSNQDFIVRARIYRLTGTDTTPATFVNGTSIRAKDLNDNFDQFLFTMQERQNQIEALETGVIADGTIGTTELADDAVDADKLSDSASNDGLRAVTTNHIRDNAVTGDKLADDITVANNLTVSNNLNVTNVTTFTGNINIDEQTDGTDSKLKFRDKDGNNQAQLYADSTDLRLELRTAVDDFKIFDGTSTLIYTFGFNGNLTCHDSTSIVTANSFSGDLTGNADTATTATTSGAVDVASSGFGDVSKRPIACFGTSSTPSAGGSSQIKFPNSNAPTIRGDGLIKANNGIDVTGDVDATGDISATNLNGALGSGQVRNAIALGNEGNKGTYAFCTLVSGTVDRAAGYEASGSDLRYSNANANANGTPSGTWRLMGRLAGNVSNSSTQETSLWLRIL